MKRDKNDPLYNHRLVNQYKININQYFEDHYDDYVAGNISMQRIIEGLYVLMISNFLDVKTHRGKGGKICKDALST